MTTANLDPRRAHPGALAKHDSGGAWAPARHLMLLSRALIDLAGRRIKKLIVNMPPQHGKSLLCSQYFPAWYLSNFPTHNVVLTSYESRYATGWGRKVRDTVYRNPDVLGIRVNQEVSAAGEWEVAGHGGSMFSVGMGGAITGRPANVLVIDDPVKNAEEALSPTIRAKHWDWYRSVAKTRLAPNAVILLVMTRWHEDDLAGRILENDEDGDWHILKLPALAKPDDPLGRKPREPLWPERYGLDFLSEQRRDLGAYWYSALYDNDPQPESGMMVSRSQFRYFRDAGSHFVLSGSPSGKTRISVDRCIWFQTCDTAQKEGEENDYTVVTTFVLCPTGDLLVYDVIREKLMVPKQYPLLMSQRERYDDLLFQAVEEKNAGTGIIQQGKLDGNPFRVLKAKGSKKSRFTAAAIFYENGQIFHRLGVSWLTQLEDEVLVFPNGSHDDIADTIAYAALLVQDGRVSPMGADGKVKKAGWSRKQRGKKAVRR